MKEKMENSRFEFRAWNKETKIMMDPHKLTPLALHPEVKDVNGVFLPFHPDIILMQFTGLPDRKGKKIFEGDIINWFNEKYEIIIYCATAWIRSETRQIPLYEIDNEEFEIIGNKLENPELLK